MALSISELEMTHEFPAVRMGSIGVRIVDLRAPEELDATLPASEAIRIVDGVSRLVSQEPQTASSRSSFDFLHSSSLERVQLVVGKIEGYREARHTVGAKPLVRKPHMRFEIEPAGLELAADHRQTLEQQLSFYIEFEVLEPNPHELSVGEREPMLHVPEHAF